MWGGGGGEKYFLFHISNHKRVFVIHEEKLPSTMYVPECFLVGRLMSNLVTPTCSIKTALAQEHLSCHHISFVALVSLMAR